MSPHLENCCLRLSANVAYQNAAQDIEYITGITVPAKTQQRLVHYQKFEQPVATADITELSADGGKARLITPLGEKSEWKDYKAIVSEAGIVASFDQNEMIVNWANQQPLAKPVTCQTVMDMMAYGIYSRKLVVNRTEEKFWTGII